MAECSLSTGIILMLFLFARFVIISPAITRVSLFARAISTLFLIASTVGLSATFPVVAVNKMSVSFEAISTSPSSPNKISRFLNSFFNFL